MTSTGPMRAAPARPPPHAPRNSPRCTDRGDAAVRALDGVTSGSSGPVHRDHGAVRIGQVDAAALRGRPRHADVRPGVHRRRGSHAPVREGADAAPPRRGRVRLPGLQPDPHAHRRREHHAAARHRRRRRRIAAWFDTVVDTVGLRDRLSHRPSELSGGQQQRVAGRASARQPRPRSSSPTSRRATSTRRRAQELLAFLRSAVEDHGQTIVMVTHDAGAASYADRIVFLADGRIVDEMLRADDGPRPRPPEVAGGLDVPRGAPQSVLARKLRLLLTGLVDRPRRRVHGRHATC